jgi:hypothetical protein
VTDELYFLLHRCKPVPGEGLREFVVQFVVAGSIFR